MYLLDEKKEKVISEFKEKYPDGYDMLVEILNELSAADLNKFAEVVQYEVEREKMKREGMDITNWLMSRY